MRLYVHHMLFKNSFLLFGNKEQYEDWKDDIENWRCLGCFAMVGYLIYLLINQKQGEEKAN